MSKKFKLQLTLLLLVLVGAILLHPAGKSVLPGAAQSPAKKTVYYKWQDSAGNWHMADSAPDGVAAQRMEVHRDTNLIQGLAPAKTGSRQESKQGSAQSIFGDSDKPGADYLLRAGQTMQEAIEVRDMLNQRQQELEDFVAPAK